MTGEFLRGARRAVAGLIIISGVTLGIEAVINAQASSANLEPTRQSLSNPELRPLADYTVHGRVDVSTYGPDYQAHLRAITLSDKTHGTTAVFPDLHWGGPSFGAFVTSPDGSGPLYYSSLKDSFPGTALETVFAASHDGKMYVAIDSDVRGPVTIYESSNGGVDWTDTGKIFNFTIDNPNDAYAPHRDTMRKNFETAIGGPAAVSKFAVPGLQ